MVRAPSRSAPGFVFANWADTATSAAPDASTEALSLRPKGGRDGCVARKLNLEQSSLDYCRPQGADFRITSDHRNQVGAEWASIIPSWFQSGSVNVNPNAGRRVFHALGELQRSKALVCVLHTRFLQTLMLGIHRRRFGASGICRRLRHVSFNFLDCGWNSCRTVSGALLIAAEETP